MTLHNTTRMAPSPCPVCGKEIDAHTGAGDAERPEPGNLSICIGCLHLRVFADDLSLRELTPAEEAEVRLDEGVERAIRAIEQAGRAWDQFAARHSHQRRYSTPEGEVL